MKDINYCDLLLGIALGMSPLIFVYHPATAIPVVIIFYLATVFKQL